MAAESLIILSSSQASFPEGRSRLLAEFSFQPPLELQGGNRFIAVSDFQLETNGILFEAVCNLQYAKPAEFNKGEWTDVPNGRVIYCSSLEDLVKKLNR
ncbi:MAG: hypothetical protein GY820_27010, partial [Gammaproteobacteria bacterium]|nr:hypothetical protein [Gammaproteobacteria bacterium]